MTTHILTHFHKRRTGVTTHVEDLTKALNGLGRETFALGESLSPDTPQLSRSALLDRLHNGASVTWHAHRPHSLRDGLKLRKQWPKLRVVWTHHSWKAPGWLTRNLLAQADARVCLTREGAKQLALPSEVIGHGVPLDELRPQSQPPQARLGVIGRIRPDKGHRSVVQAFRELQKTAPDWELCFFGETRPQHRRFERDLRTQLPEGLRVVGFESDRSAMYASLSAVIMPSPAEGFSLVVPETLAAGLPLVTTRLAHFERCLRDGEHALFYDSGQPDSLLRVLRRLFEDGALRSRLRQGARKAAEEHFSIVEEARRIAGVYDRVILDSASL